MSILILFQKEGEKEKEREGEVDSPSTKRAGDTVNIETQSIT